VFLSQLRSRALLLDDCFQRQILHVVKLHESPEGNIYKKKDGIDASNTRLTSSGSALRQSSSHDSMASLVNSVKKSVNRDTTKSSLTEITSPSTRQSVLRAQSASTSSSGTVSGTFVLFSNPLQQTSMVNMQNIFSKDEEMMQTFLTNADARASDVVRNGTIASCEVACKFDSGTSVATVEVVPAPVKALSRMQDKLLEYVAEGSQWPLSACILDPVRASVVCSGPSQILEVLSWFVESGREPTENFQKGLVVRRVKNKFSMAAEEVQGGYRDIMVLMVYTEPRSKLRIIGEVQIQDKILYEYKLKVRNANI
jgi:hypothetical protein